MRNDLLYFDECSALDGNNIQNLFLNMAKFLYLKFKDQMEDARTPSYIGAKSQFTASIMSQDDRSI